MGTRPDSDSTSRESVTSDAPLRVATLIDGDEEYGMAQAVANIAEALESQRVHAAGVALGKGRAADLLATRFAEFKCLETGPIMPLRPAGGRPYDPYYLAGRFRILCLSIRALSTWLRRRSIHIVHTHTPLMARIAAAAAHSTISVIWHCHGPYNLGAYESRWLVGFARRRIACIICISEFVAGTLPRELRPLARVVHNGVAVARLAQEARPAAFRAAHGLRPDQPLIGIFGAIMPRKGHRYFLEAAARVVRRFPDARFAIVGGPTSGLQTSSILATLDDWIRELGLEDAVIRTGFLPDATRFMTDFDVLTMPTVPVPEQVGEGFGLVMIEGMAQGVATIASDCGAPREVIQDGVNGLLVPPKDAIALADAIVKILEDAPLRRRLAQAGARTVAERFDARTMAKKLESTYCDLAAGGPLARRSFEAQHLNIIRPG